MTRPIRAAIIGCGNVAGRYDETAGGGGIFSHAGAYRSYPNVEIAACCDPDRRRLEEFSRRWKVKDSYRDIDRLLEKSYDIVSVCTPDSTHQSVIEKILKLQAAGYIWAEKPLTTSVKGAEKIIAMARRKGIGIWLSNQRRWEPAHMVLRGKIRNGALGEIVHATGYYVKGITHIGCTMVDTLRFLLGEVSRAAAFGPFSKGNYGSDRSLNGILYFRSGTTAAIAGCDTARYTYSIFEIDIIGRKGRVRIESNGDVIRTFGLKGYRHYPGFRELKPTGNINTGMKYSMKHMLGLILKKLAAGDACVDSAEEGLKDLKVIEALKKSAAKNGAKVRV